MLPPGIFIWESESKRPESQSLAALHQRWKADVDAFGPWQESVHIDGVGGFWRSDAENQTTVVVTESCSSTMEQARVLAEQGVLGEWGALVAGVQLSGRGQLRRPWVSSAGNLHVSVVMPASPKTGEWRTALDSLLSLFAGYIFSVVLTQLGTNIQLKWPNDLLQDGKKVGGLLIEEKNGIVILGLGINLVECPSDEAMREDRSAQAGVLETSDNCGGPLSLWCTLVNRGKACIQSCSTSWNLLNSYRSRRSSSPGWDVKFWFGKGMKIPIMPKFWDCHLMADFFYVEVRKRPFFTLVPFFLFRCRGMPAEPRGLFSFIFQGDQ